MCFRNQNKCIIMISNHMIIDFLNVFYKSTKEVNIILINFRFSRRIFLFFFPAFSVVCFSTPPCFFPFSQNQTAVFHSFSDKKKNPTMAIAAKYIISNIYKFSFAHVVGSYPFLHLPFSERLRILISRYLSRYMCCFLYI